MLDFMIVSTRATKRGITEIYPKFIIYNQSRRITDLMIRGGDFYAIWIEELGLWSTDERDALLMIDRELDIYAKENEGKFELGCKVIHMWDTEYGMIDKWHKFCQKQMRDCFHMLDEKLIFANTVKTTKSDFATKKLPYALEPCETPSYDRLMSILYSPEEREKIEWAIGSIVSGDSKKIQKFMVLYGAAGTGKSTVLNIIQQLFDGYYSVFDARSLGSSNNAFALEAFKSNPLVAIQHDGDLSHIEDNTRLNSLVSHEMMTVNEKFKSQYANRFKCFLFMGTNKPVKITDAKSGLIRRLIDVSPTGEKLNPREYNKIIKQIEFELGGIASHCLEVYKEDPGKYDNYIPVSMLSASNDFYNYVMDSYLIFEKENGVSLKRAWELYKTYCEEAKVAYPLAQRAFKEELKNYFDDYKERYTLEDGSRARSYFVGFKKDKFDPEKSSTDEPKTSSLTFSSTNSLLDILYKDCPAQYATEKETPASKWEKVTTTLKDIDTSKLHYVKIPQNHIVIDFDIPDENGNKSFELNLAAASKWPPTYAELSKSGKGIHLHYIYSGDASKLYPNYEDHIEIKVFSGNSSLRRKLTKCNDIPVRTISSGLPLKGEKVVNFEAVKNEKSIRAMIKKNLNKEIHANTKPSVDFIVKILEDAYNSGIHYDVTDMRPAIMAFAANSTHQADICLKMVANMKFKSDDPSLNEEKGDKEIAFFDVEIFPNLFLLCWKKPGEKQPVRRMFNPSPNDIEKFVSLFNLVGFNCRRYDNHIVYAAMMGYNNEQLYELSQRIITGSKNCFFGEAYNLSYTDIYDFSSVKQSLKKFEIDLGIHHEELGYAWDQPVPEDRWNIVAQYCDNDVIATEAVFNDRQADFTARKILADIAGMTVNDTTNSLTTHIIFGKDRHPQDQFNYRDMGTEIPPFEMDNKDYSIFDDDGKPLFPGYVFQNGKSIYRGEEVGEGGYVYAEPGMYGNVALLDIASMHPSSIIAENLFGTEYTQRFKDIRDARVLIKHGEFDKVKKMFGGKLERYLTDEGSAKQLAQALKIAINSVYGLTAANFDNPFRDIRNKDNIVAKRGALFMINLKHEVQARGFKVAHIKTDSIKIPDATQDIIDFVMEYGKRYGYTFEHEATYERMCLVNDAVYVARYSDGTWTATGTQFQVPYVFKTLFSHEPITFDDLCETKSVTSALYLRPISIVNPLTGEEELVPADTQPEFVGRVGRFCPIKKGMGGKELLRECRGKDGEIKYSAAVGTKGYSWLEAEVVKNLGKEDTIDRGYYEELVKKAIETICLYGNYDWFLSDRPYQPPKYVDGKPVYPEAVPFN